MASDNTTGQAAEAYDREIGTIIPYHVDILATAIDVARTARPRPASWLDTGSGPGHLVQQARALASSTGFWLADPSPAMLAIARRRLSDLPSDRFIDTPSERLPDVGPFDIVTAILCHHYGDEQARERAVRRCNEVLAPGGILVTFENVRADTELGHSLQRARWAKWQRQQGRDEETVQKHLAREGRHFFPITVADHLALFHRVGFRTIELVWRAHAQAGFFCIK